MSSLPFVKYCGSGNDFVVVAADAAGLAGRDRGQLARGLCARRRSIGADGLLVVGPPGESGEIPVDYHNADGSPAVFCGNGARCAADYAIRRWGPEGGGRRLRFPLVEVTARPHRLGIEIELAAPTPKGGRRAVLEASTGDELEVTVIDAGVPHAVAFIDGIAGRDLAGMARAMRQTRWGGELNLTLAEPLGPGRLAIRTDERGCGETLACGSGALAAGALHLAGRAADRCAVLPPGGSELQVRIEANRCFLAGEARAVYRGEWTPE